MIRKEAWPFYRTSSGVRLCWASKNLKDLKDLKGPEGPGPHACHVSGHVSLEVGWYRGSSLVKITPLLGPYSRTI